MNRTLGTVAALLAVVAIGSTASAGLVNYYPFEQDMLDYAGPQTGHLGYVENVGTTATNLSYWEGGSSPIYTATPTYKSDGHSGYAIYVDAPKNDYTPNQLLFPSGNADLTVLGTEFTIEMWVRGPTAFRFGTCTTDEIVKANNFNMRMPDYSGVGTRTLNVGNTSDTIAAPSVDTWLFWALVVDGTSWEFFENGSSVASGSSATIAGLNDLQFGSVPTARLEDYGVTIDIDELAMWDAALTSTVIGTHYTSGYGLTLIPEPATLAILALGGAALWLRRRRRA